MSITRAAVDYVREFPVCSASHPSYITSSSSWHHTRRLFFEALKRRFISFSYSQYQPFKRWRCDEERNVQIAQSGNVICCRSDIRHVDISIRCPATAYKKYINGTEDRPSARFDALFSRDVSFLLLALPNLARPQKWGKNERPMRYHFHLKVKSNFIWFDFEFFMNESGNAEGNRIRRYTNTTTVRLLWRCWWVSILRTSGLLYFRCKVSIIIIGTLIGLFVIR